MWTYSIRSGELRHDGRKIATGYSGKSGECRNNPDAITKHDCGPIPSGIWLIGWHYDDPRRGPITIRLDPAPTTILYGRSGFLIHGDNAQHDASTGCIILDRMTREQIVSSDDRLLMVTL